ncbi:MAG: hypothetical protein P8Y64_02770 [Gammaproteobacteria bacterium]|jgi:hypothetical protein
MDIRETFRRGTVLERIASTLPADIYNRAHLLLSRCGRNCLFVPIRAIQYMAVIDAEEIIFVDGQGDRSVELAWREFRPQARDALHEPVPFMVEINQIKGYETMKFLQGEFAKALLVLEQRSRATQGATTASVHKLDRH